MKEYIMPTAAVFCLDQVDLLTSSTGSNDPYLCDPGFSNLLSKYPPEWLTCLRKDKNEWIRSL